MANTQGRKKSAEALQTVAVLAGIPLGVVPLVKYFTSDNHSGGIYSKLFGEELGTLGLVLPTLVIILVVLLVGFLEVVKKRN
ncbi:hypothetical protein ACL02S_12420 [Nocardia sp. 004]|uniref:hypothetical protein n=1 Tax=Nocardia sp. 004 TaxID=3385978 RepID=UPI0039A0E2EF